MAIIIANHKVKDFDAWKPYYDGDRKRRKQSGIKELKMGRKADDPNEVFFIWESNDPQKIIDMANNPELKELMQKSGVVGELSAIVLNEVK